MVAATWQWDSIHMLANFGWRATLAVLVNATVAVAVLRNHLRVAPGPESDRAVEASVPFIVVAVHLALLAGVVLLLAHHPVAFLSLFLGFTQAYERHLRSLILKEALLTDFFLAGLIVLGGMQQ